MPPTVTTPRTVTLLMVDATGAVLGALPPFEVTIPWWSSTSDIVAGARERYGLDVTVLRILGADQPMQPGGSVTYVAQASGDLPDKLGQVADDLRAAAEADHPLRLDYARPGGPQATLSWAIDVLDGLGRTPVPEARQQRSWNLSSIWRLATREGPAWIKEVPAFFGHEPAVLRWLVSAGHGSRTPLLLASDGRRMLLDHIPGEDLYESDAATRLAIAADMHAIQSTVDIERLLAIGVPDRRNLTDRLTEVATTSELIEDPRLRRLVDGIPERLKRIAECGLPDTLVHGDLHPGNVLGTAEGKRIILDWGDCVVGNPAFDILRLTGSLPADEAGAVQRAWVGWWRDAVPGCDPVATIDLLRPVSELYYASIYADFLANIEPSEHPYHAADVPAGLARAAALAD